MRPRLPPKIPHRAALGRPGRGSVALLGIVLGCGALACGSKGAVAITAAIESPVMSVDRSSALAAQMTGAFRLHLELGEHASEGTGVSISQGNFGLVAPGSQATLVLLKFTTAPAAPYHLDPGGQLAIAFTIGDRAEAPGQLLTKDEESAVCAAHDAVQLTGSISDNSGAVPVSSTPFAIACP
jgi:hypothetical protein